MSHLKIDYEELKKSGYIIQRGYKLFTVRLRIPGGRLTSKQLIEIGRIAEKYGNGYVHLTGRQGLQIPNVEYEKLKDITKELTDNGTPPGSCGPRVRNVSSCPGLPECVNANIDCYSLAKKIDEKFFDWDLPTKFKIAISGCPNSCSKPQLNDIGIMGVVKPKIISERCSGCGLCVDACKEAAIRIKNGLAVIDYTKCVFCGQCTRVCPVSANVIEKVGYSIFIGGKVGRHPQFGYKLIDFANEEMVFKVIERSLEIFKKEAIPGERFGHLVDRIGISNFLPTK